MLSDKTRSDLLSMSSSTEDEFISLLIHLKEEGKLTCSWEDISVLVEEKYGEYRSSTWYRRHKDEYLDDLQSNLDVIKDQILELKKARVALSDERTQNNAYIRRLSREDTIIEIAKDFAEKMNSKKLLSLPNQKIVHSDEENEGILMLSDWHFGMEIDSAFNKYSPEICKERVSTLLRKVIEIGKANNVKKINVLNLSDLIAGRIHLQLRLESRFDVITQIMEVSEILAEFLSELSNSFELDYYSCIDNHSRLEPKKQDALELESLCRITDWYLKDRLKDNVNIHMHENVYGPDIITFQCKGFNIGAVHGDADSPTVASTSISRLTAQPYDLVCMAHRHHFTADELNCCIILGNSSLMGTDEYSRRLRLSAKPSQNLVIVSENNVTEAIYRIVLE